MFLSMTGFGSKSCDFPWGTAVLDVSSTNHKFQDFSIKLPPELISLENRMLNILRSKIARGRVKVSVTMTWLPGAEVPTVNEDALMSLYNQVKRITKRNSLECPSDISNLLLIPGLFEASHNVAERAAVENPEIWDEITVEAVEALIESKRSEGEKIKSAIEEDAKALEKILAAMAERWKIAQNDALDSIRLRIENVLEHYNLELDEARIAEEVALASDRWDVSEEITRMKSHMEKFHQVMDAEFSSGKKLDFLIQEMIREINTMGSKVADAEFRWLVVEAKSAVEKMREQVQNVE